MKSFLHGKHALAAAPLRAPAALVAGPAAGPAAAAGPAPHIDVVKQGDKIVRIIVQCPCGQHTEIECLYPPGR